LADLCACGCGEEIKGAAYHGVQRKAYGERSRYKRGHWEKVHAKGFGAVHAKNPKRLQNAKKARYVPAAPVQKVLREHGWTAAKLYHELHVSRSQAQRLFKDSDWMTPEWAERLLRLAAGLPRSPTKREREQAIREWWAAEQRRLRRGEKIGKGKRRGLIAAVSEEELRLTAHLAKKRRAM
jgi:hypothetical protein